MAQKILLINPPYAHYGGVSGQGGKSAPLNLAYLASYIREKRARTDVIIIDAEALELTFEDIYEKVKRFSPHIIGITCPTVVYYNVQKICSDLKSLDKEIKIVLGGPHPTARPLETLKETNCDVVVIGEGELTFLDLVDAFNGGKHFDKIAGIAYKKNGEVFVNQRRELIANLDEIPFPAKDLLPLDKYYLPPTKRIKSERATTMVTSRGCPFDCGFCMASTIWERKTRLRSVKNVVDEIKYNTEALKLTELSFHDELFTAKRSRVIEVCREILKQKLDISWVCHARAGSVDIEMLRLMREAGCGKISFGLESGSRRMLEIMNKKANLNDAIESVRFCQEAGIKAVGTFVLGYPGEDRRSIEETIEFAIKLDCDTVSFFIAIPYPGTRLYNEAIEKDYLKDGFKWDEFAPLAESPMEIPNFTKKELVWWKNHAYKRYYFRPSYILKKLGQIRSLSDFKNAYRGVSIFKKVVS